MADPDAIRYLRIAQADLAEALRMVAGFLAVGGTWPRRS